MAYYVENGRTSNNIVLEYDVMHISSGGVANNTTVDYYGDMYISSGGVANSTTVNSDGEMYISSGGMANRTTMNDGYMNIEDGGTASSTTMSGGYMYINGGGVANSTTMNDGYMYIYGGGVANRATVNSCGSMNIQDGGVANSTTLSGGMMYISSGVANRTTVNSGGFMNIQDGGVANSTTVNDGGEMYIYSGGCATALTLSAGGMLNGFSFAEDKYWENITDGSAFIADNVYIVVDCMHISSGGVANSTTLSGGMMYISSGGVANRTTVNSWGSMRISSGGVANSTTVNSWGSMRISSGGVANRTTVNSWGDMNIEDGGVANSTTVNQYGHMYITSGGVANSTTVNSDGDMYLRSGGVANSTTVNDGYMYISSGGVANSTTMSGGWMYISSGGTATDITAKSGAYLGITVASDTYIQGTYNGSAFEMKDAYISGYTVNSDGRMYISSGGVANDTTVNPDGYMHISNGGVANRTTVNDGWMDIYSGGVANNTTVNSGSWMIISSGGVANSTTVNSTTAGMIIISGGVANNTTVNYVGNMTINSGGVANSTTVNSWGRMSISSGGTANSTTVNYGGSMFITSGGSATALTLSAGGMLGRFSFAEDKYWENITDGSAFIADNVYIIDSKMYISNGGVANSTTVNYGGSMFISSGGVHKGSLQIKSGAYVSAFTGSIIDFTVADRKTSDGYLINNLSAIQGYGYATYTITVADNQKSGVYKLAQGASNFTGTLTIGSSTAVIGEISVGEILSTTDGTYLLNQTNGSLNLIVKKDGNILQYSGDDVDNLVFISSKYNAKTTGKKQDGITLTYNSNAFDSIGNVANASEKIVVVVDSKVNGNDYANLGKVAAVVMIESEKISANSCTYKVAYTAKGTLNITANTGSTEFLRFATISVENATVGNARGGKLTNNEELKITVDKKGTVTNTEKSTLTGNVAGKFTAINGSAGVVENYATVNLTGAEVTTLSGGNTKETSNSKLVDGETKDQKTISTVNDSVAAGSVTLKNQAKADTISGYSNVTLTDSVAGDITNFTSKDSKSETATYDEAKNTVTRNVTLSHSETTAGTLKATNSTLGDVTGFATVTLQNVTEAGDFRRVDSNGNKYSTVKETLTIKTNKDGSVAGTYSKTEIFTRAGKFTATGSTVGDIENFSNVTLDGSKAEAISNFVEAKIVTTGKSTWDNADQYGRPEDYALNLQGWNMEKPVETKSLNGSVTLKNGASADSIENFKSVTMTGSEVVGTIKNVEKVTVNKGDSTIGSYTGTNGNDTLTIAKGAVLTANKIDLGKGDKDKLAINGTLILTGTEIKAANITGKGEIAVVEELFDKVTVDFANLLNVGVTADNFRGTAYENADDSAKKAVKWDGKTEYNGWLGAWGGYKEGSDKVDYIKFKAAENAQLTVSGDVDWVLLDKKGNDIGKEITVAGEYTIKLNHDEGTSISYQIKLA